MFSLPPLSAEQFLEIALYFLTFSLDALVAYPPPIIRFDISHITIYDSLLVADYKYAFFTYPPLSKMQKLSPVL